MAKNEAWIVAVNMGYGHQRTAFPLRNFAAEQTVINANDYDGIPENDRKIWESTRRFYEFMSDFKRIPIVGNFVFSLYNKFQEIPTFYPRRDLSRPTFSLKRFFSIIKNGWGRDLISRLTPHQNKFGTGREERPLPLITTFFTPAFMAEVFQYPGEIFCVVCDADISRSWAPPFSKQSRIKYLAPNSWVKDRLKLYGVKEENIFLTGYPLPEENIGSREMEILKSDLGCRLLNLDPKKEYEQQYKSLIEKEIGLLPEESGHPLTIMFSIGGAGAQKEMAIEFMKSLSPKIKNGEIKIILSAGIRENVKEYFIEKIKQLGFGENIGKNLEIIFSEKIGEYFEKFNQALRKTDILWTKPSELSFYSGLGIPIIIAPTIGSQEEQNLKWLLRIGSGILQENPKYAEQWLFDYLNSGRFAEAAMQGFVEIEKLGTYNIKKICFG